MYAFHWTSFLVLGLVFISCGDDDNTDPVIDTPTTYSFQRNGQSTVAFSGQTTRIKMATELASSMLDFDNATEASLLEMYRNETAAGQDANPFTDPELNNATKSVREKVAASRDYFFANSVGSNQIKTFFEQQITAQINDVFPFENQAAAPGQAGQIADGSSTRWVNEFGLEHDQALGKGLIGALMLDQALNNYLSPAVLDEGTNRADNNEGVTADGKTYTNMEHKWDEAYGYLYGLSPDAANPNATIGTDDGFLNKYVGRVENDPDFTGIAQTIFDAFSLGRNAIVAKNYNLRDEQSQIIRQALSEVIAIRAIYYLQAGKRSVEQIPPDMGDAFHQLSEAYGFIYSLQFTREPGTEAPYFSDLETLAFLNQLFDDGPDGLWDITPSTLDEMSEAIAERFDFTVVQAAN